MQLFQGWFDIRKQRKQKKKNAVDSEPVMSRPKTTKTKKSSMNIDDSVGPSSKTIYSNDKLSKVEDDFHVFS